MILSQRLLQNGARLEAVLFGARSFVLDPVFVTVALHSLTAIAHIYKRHS